MNILNLTTKTSNLFYSKLFWISIFEFIIILILLIRTKKSNKYSKEEILFGEKIVPNNKQDIDKMMDAMMDNIHLSRSLYRELTRVCHPDRFVNDGKQNVAESIFQEITENENNYSKLKELKNRAEIELEVKFIN